MPSTAATDRTTPTLLHQDRDLSMSMGTGSRAMTDEEITALRVDMAAGFRLAVQFDWHESVGNPFTAAVSSDGKRFLAQSALAHFGSLRASGLMLLDATDTEVMKRPDAPDPS